MRRANKGVLPSVLGVDGYNPSVGGASDPIVPSSAPTATAQPAASGSAGALQSANVKTISSTVAATAVIGTSSTETKQSALQKIESGLTTLSRYCCKYMECNCLNDDI